MSISEENFNSFIRYEYYDPDNKIVLRKKYYLGLYLHREDGPAVIHYYDNGSVKWIEYYYYNSPHRVYGPSDIYYDRNGKVEDTIWWYEDNEYTSEVYEWIDENKFKSYKEMSEEDFNRMWFEIL